MKNINFSPANGAEYAFLVNEKKYRSKLPESARVGDFRANLYVGRNPNRYLEYVRFTNKAGRSWDVKVSKEDAKADKVRRIMFYKDVTRLKALFVTGTFSMRVKAFHDTWSMRSLDYYGNRVTVDVNNFVITLSTEARSDYEEREAAYWASFDPYSPEYPVQCAAHEAREAAKVAPDFICSHHTRQDGDQQSHTESAWLPKASHVVKAGDWSEVAFKLSLYTQWEEMGAPVEVTKTDLFINIMVNGETVMTCDVEGRNEITGGDILQLLKRRLVNG